MEKTRVIGGNREGDFGMWMIKQKAKWDTGLRHLEAVVWMNTLYKVPDNPKWSPLSLTPLPPVTSQMGNYLSDAMFIITLASISHLMYLKRCIYQSLQRPIHWSSERSCLLLATHLPLSSSFIEFSEFSDSSNPRSVHNLAPFIKIKMRLKQNPFS